HFALLPGGHLFLGSSESVEDGSGLFSVVDKKHRIYRQRPSPRTVLPVQASPVSLALAGHALHAWREGPVIAGSAFHRGAGPLPATPGNQARPSWGELHLRLLE